MGENSYFFLKISYKLILKLKNHAYYCNYLGFWYCPQCISKEKRPLWWKAVEEFDITAYEISNDAKKEIDELMMIPNLELKRDSDLVRANKKLSEFLVKILKINKKSI